jgi:hypothetical protein
MIISFESAILAAATTAAAAIRLCFMVVLRTRKRMRICRYSLKLSPRSGLRGLLVLGDDVLLLLIVV